MAILKASALEQHISRRRLASSYLVYGPDTGKVGETARRLVAHVAGSIDDPFAVSRLTEDSLADSGRLADEILSRPMLGGRKAIWFASPGNDFLKALEKLGPIAPGGNVLIIEAGNLPKSSRLRALFEHDPESFAIACYEDSLEDLDQLIEDSFAAEGLTLSPAAKGALLGHLGEDRTLSRGEIEKLILYCLGSGRVDLADVEAVCSGRTTADLDDLNDAVFAGELSSTDTLVDRHLKAGTPGSRLLAAASFHLSVLEKFLLDVENGAQPVQAVRAARPPIFFQRHGSLIQQLNTWNSQTIVAAADTLAQATLQTREFAALESQIAGRALLSLSRLAAEGRSGRSP
jgi:DNA polymerase III subunit delta